MLKHLASKNFSDPREITLDQIEGRTFLVDSGGYTFPCRYNSFPGSRFLFVMLHDSVDRRNHPLPVLPRWNWGKILRANILSIDDPTLYLDEDLSTAWYIGTKERDVIPGLARICQTVATRLGLIFSRIVFYGSGSGGFAAIAAAMHCSASCVAINPHTDLHNIETDIKSPFSTMFDPACSPEENRTSAWARWNMTGAVGLSKRYGRFPCIVVVQDVHDSSTYSRHYLPFCEALKVPHTGGIGFHGLIKTIPVDSETPQGADSLAIVWRILSEGMPFIEKFHYADVSQLDPDALDGKPFAVQSEGLTFPCRYNSHPGSKTLFVAFHAAVDREKKTLPLYARWNWGKILNGNILCIDDPTLYLNDRLRIAWYIGTREKDVIQGVVRIAETFAERMGLTPSQIIFYGDSAGGFAAIAAAAKASATCVAINPQTQIALYEKNALAAFAKVFDPASSPEQSSTAFPTRWSAIEAVRAARSAGRTPRVLIIQNMTNDAFTVKNHYLPFCNAFDVPSDGGVGCQESIMSMTYDDEGGHDAADTPEVVREITSKGLSFLTGKVIENNNAATARCGDASLKNAEGEASVAAQKAATERAEEEKAAADKGAMYYANASEVALSDVQGKVFTVNANGIDYPARFASNPGSSLLYVALHGAVDRTQRLPVFARWNWAKILGGHVLAICDPTLFFDDELTVGWYVGDKERNVIKGVAEISSAIASKLGLRPHQVVYYGSSGGGFAAMMAAAISNGSGVAINPQTDLANHLPFYRDQFAKMFDSAASLDESRAAFPSRWSCAEAMISASAAGRCPKVVIIQNLIDTYTHREHYLPFCSMLGVPLEGGRGYGDMVMSITYSHEDGHGAADTPDVVRTILSDGLSFLMANRSYQEQTV